MPEEKRIRDDPPPRLSAHEWKLFGITVVSWQDQQDPVQTQVVENTEEKSLLKDTLVDGRSVRLDAGLRHQSLDELRVRARFVYPDETYSRWSDVLLRRPRFNGTERVGAGGGGPDSSRAWLSEIISSRFPDTTQVDQHKVHFSVHVDLGFLPGEIQAPIRSSASLADKTIDANFTTRAKSKESEGIVVTKAETRSNLGLSNQLLLLV